MNNILTFCFLALLPVMISCHGLPPVTSSCPAIYKRFSYDHSACKPPDPKCQVVTKGLDPKYIPEILDAHNKFRNKIASGQEERAGGMPPAADMLQLTWDEELAYVAQKWTEQCYFEHECWRCRAIRSFAVGQNLALYSYYCKDERCYKEPEWTHVVTGFYDEVEHFDRNMVKSLVFAKKYGHFVGVCYAEAYKIGCGYIAYIDGGWARELYACDYGPSASMAGERMYLEGPPCSKCPSNSCCGKSCGENSYPSLCKLSSVPPVYTPKRASLYLCSFQQNDPKCHFAVEGPDKWEYAVTVGGIYLNLNARPGTVNKAHFTHKISVDGESCFLLTYRRGPQVYGQSDESVTVIELEKSGLKIPSMKLPPIFYFKFTEYELPFILKGDIKFTIKFTVDASAAPQFLEIKRIEIVGVLCGNIKEETQEELHSKESYNVVKQEDIQGKGSYNVKNQEEIQGKESYNVKNQEDIQGKGSGQQEELHDIKTYSTEKQDELHGQKTYNAEKQEELHGKSYGVEDQEGLEDEQEYKPKKLGNLQGKKSYSGKSHPFFNKFGSLIFLFVSTILLQDYNL